MPSVKYVGFSEKKKGGWVILSQIGNTGIENKNRGLCPCNKLLNVWQAQKIF